MNTTDYIKAWIGYLKNNFYQNFYLDKNFENVENTDEIENLYWAKIIGHC